MKLCLCPAELPACSNFAQKVITNGDRIQQMSNEELAVLFATMIDEGDYCLKCPSVNYCETLFSTDHETPIVKICEKGLLHWLNAPADCVGKDINVRTKEKRGRR